MDGLGIDLRKAWFVNIFYITLLLNFFVLVYLVLAKQDYSIITGTYIGLDFNSSKAIFYNSKCLSVSNIYSKTWFYQLIFKINGGIFIWRFLLLPICNELTYFVRWPVGHSKNERFIILKGFLIFIYFDNFSLLQVQMID